MNTKHILAASVAALVSTAGFAQHATTVMHGDTQTYETPDTSMLPEKSRAEVRAELKEAHAENTIVVGDTQSYAIPEDAMVSEKSRAEVMRELRQARANGELSPQADNHGPDAEATGLQPSY